MNIEKFIHVDSLEGMLKVPHGAKGIVLFAHGSGSSRLSPRNNFVADTLNKSGLGTLLIDLLSREEDEDYQNRFNIELLTKRLTLAARWLTRQPETKNLPMGLFGASTGAAAALCVASIMSKEIKAVVSRGGRPDLALPILHLVDAPTLLIVGGNDFDVIKLNQMAYEKLPGIKELEIIPEATHLFEEPGCLEAAALSANKWFKKYLTTKTN